jgi:hypothetical protein
MMDIKDILSFPALPCRMLFGAGARSHLCNKFFHGKVKIPLSIFHVSDPIWGLSLSDATTGRQDGYALSDSLSDAET